MARTGAQIPIRVATGSDFSRLSEIETESDAMFASLGIGPFKDDGSERDLAAAAAVFVAGEPPVGFIAVEIVDGAAHIWQLSVVPAMQRRGLGRALVAKACEWARSQSFEAVTLTTFRDVAWNGPFYENLGSYELRHLTPGLEIIRQHERDIGDDDMGPRIAMRLEL